MFINSPVLLNFHIMKSNAHCEEVCYLSLNTSLFADSTCVRESWICGTDKRRLWWKIRSFNALDSLEFFFEVKV